MVMQVMTKTAEMVMLYLLYYLLMMMILYIIGAVSCIM